MTRTDESLANMLLGFDAPAFVEATALQAMERIQLGGFRGMALGASGGIDSMVTAALCCRAAARAGKIRAVAVSMTDTRLRGERYNTELYWDLGADVERIDITDDAIRAETRMRLPPRWLTLIITRGILGGLPRPLRRKVILATISRSLPRWALRHHEALLLHHRIRIERLRQIADQRRYLVVICANRTEAALGYYVEGGIDDPRTGDWAPIIGLYKTQVALTAEYLRISPLVMAQKPSPGFGGIGDEGILGPYALVDQALIGISRGDTDETVARSIDPGAQVRLPWSRGTPRFGKRLAFVRFIRSLANAARKPQASPYSISAMNRR